MHFEHTKNGYKLITKIPINIHGLPMPITNSHHWWPYNSRVGQDFQTINKLLPWWSKPLLITRKHLNSYTLSDLHGMPLTGLYHIHRLWLFIPLWDSTLGLIYPHNVQDLSNDKLGLIEVGQRMMEPWETLVKPGWIDQGMLSRQRQPLTWGSNCLASN